MENTKPNFLFIISDQLGLDAIGAHGCVDVNTPNMDRMIARGTTFIESHSTSPVCSPARSSFFTGRMPIETGVPSNNLSIIPGMPVMGEWMGDAGYDTLHCGKWHMPDTYPASIRGFTVLPSGGGQGDIADANISRTCEAYIKNRDRANPFLLVASFMNPHDICYWTIKPGELVPEGLRFSEIVGELPELPPNFASRPVAPADLVNTDYKGYVNDEQWRYYLYVYYRQVEMVDREIGRLLDALEDSGQADNTIVIFTSDHGDGRGRHKHVQKWYPYDEALKVPMVVSCPGTVAEGRVDTTHLVSGLDVLSTMCDYAGIAPPPGVLGLSLRPLCEDGPPPPWREFVAAEARKSGRVLRTAQYKYVRYPNDPVEQLFDMLNDPWEMENLYDNPTFGAILQEHRDLLDGWETGLIPA